MKNKKKDINSMSTLEIVDYVANRSLKDLKDLTRIAAGRIHSLTTTKRLTTPVFDR